MTDATDVDQERRDRLAGAVDRLRLRAVGADDELEADRARLAQQLNDEWSRRIPPRFRTAVLDDVQPPTQTELVEWVCAGPNGNLVLLGPVGVGKTFAAVAALRMAHEHGQSIMFAPIVEVLELLRPGGPDDLTQRLGAVRVLVLDDLGAERPTDWTAERLYSIVNRRWLDEKPTIVTTNLKPDELAAKLDPRMFSRLVHNATAVRLSGPDRRRA